MARLIRERRRLKGKIDRLEKSLLQLPQQIADLQAQLKSLDDVFPLSEGRWSLAP